MGYKGSPEKVPNEYWEYRLVDEHFRGNWQVYWLMPEHYIDMILGFKKAEYDSVKLQEKRNNARQKNRSSHSN